MPLEISSGIASFVRKTYATRIYVCAKPMLRWCIGGASAPPMHHLKNSAAAYADARAEALMLLRKRKPGASSGKKLC
ncbi:hypothetical protein KDAU_28010 [Dictyobacter aurantiacus]|uniref:Uncharacterized protein n=1 Tax=Dictyobacter aurantiacus TaxID=1936993 RepID=A0A401ZF32_9CHLR|nr:hypothetical protein KDAU_28010 [Dictyobacter aurantiacus]